MNQNSKTSQHFQIIFFDGVCNLCNHFVSFVIQQDRKRAFRFASLQGEKAKTLLNEAYTQHLDTVILYHQGKTYDQSTAALKILCSLNWGGKSCTPCF